MIESQNDRQMPLIKDFKILHNKDFKVFNRTVSLEVEVPFTPQYIDTQMWLDADDAATITLNGSNVAQWDDKSGKGNNAAQVSAGLQPAYNAVDTNLSNMSSVGANGTSYRYLVTPSVLCRNIYLVTYYNDPDNTFDSWDIMITENPLSTYRWGGWSTKNYFQDNGMDTVHKDGDTTVNYASLVPVLPMAASQWRARWDGDKTSVWRILAGNATFNIWRWGGFGEIIFTDGTESEEIRQKIEGYLAWKWNLVGSLPVTHPYKTSPPTTFIVP